MKLFGQDVSARKGFYNGAHRTRPPAQTLGDYMRLMPQLGITRLANVTGLDSLGLPVCVAVRPNSRALATTQGKGETIEAAKASALMEAIESWHGERVRGPVHVESYRELACSGAAVDPRLLGIRADATLYTDRPLEWIEGEELLGGQRILTPFETVSTNFVELPDRRPTFLKTTNGLASGNHVLEAVVHGLLEVIERDALALWGLRSPQHQEEHQIDLHTIDDPHIQSVLEVLREKGVTVGICDIASDIGVPAFTCTLVDDPGSVHWRAIPKTAGHGAHLDPRIALSRALHEAIQSRVTVISGSRDDLFPRDYDNARGREDHVRMIAQFARAQRPFCAGQSQAADWFEQDLATLLARLKKCGIDCVVAVDLTRGDVGVPVVKVVVPGLETVRTALYRPGLRARRLMEKAA